MENYQNMTWTEYITTEQARLLLPLSWYVRVKQDQNSKNMLKIVATDVYNRIQSFGGIQEWLGPGACLDCPPASNAAYGTGEGPIVQNNGDTCNDYLYTHNFALIGFLEASYAVPSEPMYKNALNQLSEFTVRIQSTSDKFSYLDGTWYRAFDYGMWDYYGSASDWLWGPWCIESGWTSTWITTVFTFRNLNTSMWDFIAQAPIDINDFDAACADFLDADFCSSRR